MFCLGASGLSVCIQCQRLSSIGSLHSGSCVHERQREIAGHRNVGQTVDRVLHTAGRITEAWKRLGMSKLIWVKLQDEGAMGGGALHSRCNSEHFTC